MKNKKTVLSCFFLAFCSIFYFVLLECASPSFPSFSAVWLIAALFFITAGLTGPTIIKRRFVRFLLGFTACIAGLVIITCVWCIRTPAVSDGTASTKYVIVLGGGILPDGSLSSIPRRRIEKAAAYMKVHTETTAIVTGGKGRFAPTAEAPVLAAELEKNGIESHRIIEEDQAKDTIQNFLYSARIIARTENKPVSTILHEPVTIITSYYHLARAERLAHRMGFTAVYGIGTTEPLLFILNSYGREIGAWIKLSIRIVCTGKPEQLY